MAKTLIISVGGSLPPIIYSINIHCPANIIFFASVDTEPQITEVLRQLKLNELKNLEKIITLSAEDIGECLKSILLKLPDIVRRWQLNPEDIIVDYTGGTKSMSAALVLGTIEYTHCFSYIGGEKRNKDGVGTVINGQERALILNNPWDQLALYEKKKISVLFNLGRYSLAKEAAEEAAKKISPREKPIFNILKDLSEAYHKWDMFDYKGASHTLQRVRRDLEIFCSYAGVPSDFHSLLNMIKENERFLEVLRRDVRNDEDQKVGIEKQKFYLLDMLANAKRRALKENRYDDAIVRLYRVLELRAQGELKKYGLDSSDIRLDLVPVKIREEVNSRYFNERKKRVEVPLYAAYQIIKAIEADRDIKGVGHLFFENYEKLLAPIIDFRNKSIIVHGQEKIDKEKFNLAWQNLLKFLEIEENFLPEFPLIWL